MESLSGRAVIDGRGVILQADLGFGAIVGRPAPTLRGRAALDLCWPDDRGTMAEALARVRAGGEYGDVVQRVVRADGDGRWVRARLSTVAGEFDRFAVMIAEAAPARERIAPSELLRCARIFHGLRDAAANAFDQLFFADQPGAILLAAYIREAEGSMLAVADLPTEIGGSAANLPRWLRALESEGLIEREADGRGETVRLSCEAHRRFEQMLARAARLDAASRDAEPTG